MAWACICQVTMFPLYSSGTSHRIDLKIWLDIFDHERYSWAKFEQNRIKFIPYFRKIWSWYCMKQVLGPISETWILIDLKFELEMYFYKIYSIVKRNEATPIYSFHVYALFDSFWGLAAKPFCGSGPNAIPNVANAKYTSMPNLSSIGWKLWTLERAIRTYMSTHTHTHTHTFHKILWEAFWYT